MHGIDNFECNIVPLPWNWHLWICTICLLTVGVFSWNYLNDMLSVRNMHIITMLITSVPSVQLCVVLTYRVPVFYEILLAKGRWIFCIMGPPSCFCYFVVRYK